MLCLRAIVSSMLRSTWPSVVSASFPLFLFFALFTSFGASQSTADTPTLRDIDGHSFQLFGPQAKATVLFFVTNDCPITNNYMPEINRIVASYVPRKIAFFAVYTDPSVSESTIRQHAASFGIRIPLIHDSAHLLVRRAGATVTPEAAVFAPGGRLDYVGRIDDWYVDFGKRRAAPTQRYLRQALDEILNDKPVAIAKVPPIGCSIVP